MKTSWTTYSTAIVLTVSLLAGTAHARGGSGGGGGGHSMSGGGNFSRSSSSFNSSVYRTNGSSSGYKQATIRNQYPSNGGFAKTSQTNLNNAKNFAQYNKPSGFNKQYNGQNVAKMNGLSKYNGNKGANWKSYNKFYCGKYNCWPGNCWWGGGSGWYGGFGFGGWGCDDWYGYCYEPYYSPCYNVCYEYNPAYYTPSFSADATPSFGPQESTPDQTPAPVPSPVPTPTPVAKIVHLVNPAETQTTLGFAVNGQAYSLEAGQSQDVQINDGAVVEFDRGGDNQVGRYSLSEGTYRFASTPQGWELYRGDAAPAAESVAAN
jgi:hypothetical protein